MYCRQCGAQMFDTESFCINCSAQVHPPEKVVPLGDDEDITVVSVPKPEDNKSPLVSTRTALIIFALLLVTASVSLMIAQLWRENKSLRAQLSAKTSNDSVAAQAPQSTPTPLQTHANPIVNNFFSVPAAQRTWIPFEVPAGVRNSRIVGGFREQSGYPVMVSITNEGSKEVVYQYEPRTSSKINQELTAGSYRLEFENMAAYNATVAAEFYVKYEHP
jgi:hypothetical protein